MRVLPSPAGGYVYDLMFKDYETPVARCWLCTSKDAFEPMWEAATAIVPDERVRINRPRKAPWLAAAITLPLPFLLDARNVLFEAGDLERCIAWALIERPS